MIIYYRTKGVINIMVRMEIACFLVVALMSMMYFSVKRQKTQLHKVFSAYLITVMVHLIFDGVTIITVNKLDSIPGFVNDICHRIFIGTMIMVFYFVYLYVASMIEDDIKEKIHISRFNTPLLVVSLILNFILPIEYVVTDKGNYSYGPLAYMLYVSIVIYIIFIFIILKRYWKRLDSKKKKVTAIAMITEFLVLVVQGIYPLALISGMGIMLVTMSFYLLMENPDIMLAKQIQKEKQKAEEANAAKSVFLSRMSHEIRTPMNSVVGMTEILLRTDLTEEQKEYLNNIKTSGNALVSIINDILDISKIEAGKMELVEDVYDIHNVLNDVGMIIQNRIGEKPVRLIFDIGDGLPQAMLGDALRIRQVLINLLNNAVKFTDEGHISLTVKCNNKTEEDISLFFMVSDTGQGMKEEDLNKLFSNFTQVDIKKNIGKEGTGLGLAISSQLVDMMGGKLKVTSKYGEGSQFFFEINQKIMDENALISDENEESFEFTAPDAHILIVDDNEINRKVALGLLAPINMKIDTAENGKMAIEMLIKNKYHMVFMDHMMPVMDGVEATKYIRKMEDTYYKEVPIVALTANAMKEAEKIFEDAGINDLLSKPIDVRELYKFVLKWIPSELIIRAEGGQKDIFNSDAADIKSDIKMPQLEGIDIDEGLKNSGSYELYINLLGDYYRLIDMKSDKIEQCVKEKLVRDYTIEVHALKSASRMIGAMDLSDKFMYLERLGNENRIEDIISETPKILEMYREYKEILKDYGETDIKTKEVSREEILMHLQKLKEAMEEFDLDVADKEMTKLLECSLPDKCQEDMKKLRVYVTDVAMEEVVTIADKMIDKISLDK